jgi:hypothetical protein
MTKVSISNYLGWFSGNDIKDCCFIELIACPQFEGDLTMFSNAHTVKIKNCKNVTTLQGLKNVSFVTISQCCNLEEILSGIENNKSVKITSCTLITAQIYYQEIDISSLSPNSICVTIV